MDSVPLPPTLPDAELRRAPSREALDRLCAIVQPGARVGAVRRLRGGIASGMHAVDLVGPGDEHRWVVVRRFGTWRVEHDSQVGEREWAALTMLARAGAPTATPLWLDSAGTLFGCPTLVTSRIPGRGLLAPRDLVGWVRQLAEALAQIHAAPLLDDDRRILLDQRQGIDGLLARDEPPAVLTDKPYGPEVWAAMQRYWPQTRPVPPSLVHGDYWPGNTLWRYGKLTGVVDWEQVRNGNPAQDVACCRLDLTLLFGPDTADLFLHSYRAAASRPIVDLGFWELYVAASALEDVEHWIDGYHDLGRTDVDPAVSRATLELFAANALVRAADESGG